MNVQQQMEMRDMLAAAMTSWKAHLLARCFRRWDDFVEERHAYYQNIEVATMHHMWVLAFASLPHLHLNFFDVTIQKLQNFE